jgi:hypothetical protein
VGDLGYRSIQNRLEEGLLRPLILVFPKGVIISTDVGTAPQR